MTPQTYQVWAHARATAAALARQTAMPAVLIRRVANHFEALASAAPDPDQMRAGHDLKRALDAIAVMPMTERGVLVEREMMPTRIGFVQAVADNAARIIAAHPVLGPVAADIARADAERARFIDEQNAAQRQREADRAPADLLARLTAAGIELSLDKGNIIARPGTVLPWPDLEMIRHHKAAIVDLLKADNAPRPVVLA